MPTEPFIQLVAVDTGDVKQWDMSGVDRGWRTEYDTDGCPLPGDYYEDPWCLDDVTLALNLVPELVAAIDRARAAGDDVLVRVERLPAQGKEKPMPSEMICEGGTATLDGRVAPLVVICERCGTCSYWNTLTLSDDRRSCTVQLVPHRRWDAGQANSACREE